MTGKTKKILAFSSVLVAVCMAVIVTVCVLCLGGKGSPHIKIEDGEIQLIRGELSISLVRERLETSTLDDRGVLVDNTDNTHKDFSSSKENIFGIGKDMLIAPKCSFTAHMAISNQKPYPFEYWLEFAVTGDEALAEQIELTVTVNGETFIKRSLGDGLTTKVFPSVSTNDTARFTASLKFLSTAGNSESMNKTISFDMIVHARLIAA